MQYAVASSKDNLKFTTMTTDGLIFIEAGIGGPIGGANHFLAGFKGDFIRQNSCMIPLARPKVYC